MMVMMIMKNKNEIPPSHIKIKYYVIVKQ